MNNLIKDFTVMQSDVIFTVETWLKPEEAENVTIEGYTHHALTLEENRGKGISVFTKVPVNIIVKEVRNLTELLVAQVGSIRLICVYSKQDSENVLSRDILKYCDKSTIVLGDFNMAPLKQLMTMMKQHVNKPTFDSGSLIDHLYTNLNIEFYQHSVIFSDHDCISFKVINEQCT